VEIPHDPQGNPLGSSPVSLTGSRIVRAIMAAAIIALLSIAHVHLQFKIRDMRLQHQRMQMVKGELLQQRGHLERQNSFLSEPNRLAAYARYELGMEEITERPVAYLTASHREKYSNVSTAVASSARHGIASELFAKSDATFKPLKTLRVMEYLGFRENSAAVEQSGAAGSF